MATKWKLHPAITYETMSALCRARIVGPAPDGSGDLSLSPGRGFAGTADMPEAIAGLERGIPADTAGVVASMQRFHDAAYTVPTWEHSVSGQRVCIASYVAGEPECMLTRTEGEDVRPSVRLVLSGNAPGNVPADYLLLMASAAAVVSEALIASQVATEIVGIDATDHHLTPYSIVSFGEVLDVSKIAFSLHPSMQRRVWFAVREMSPATYPESRTRSGGYGSAPILDSAAKRLISAAVAADGVVTVFLPGPRELRDASHTTLEAIVSAFQQAIDSALAPKE